MKWETFEVAPPKADGLHARFEYVARHGLGNAIKAYELSELAIESCTDYREHLGVVLQSCRAGGLSAVLAALDHSFRWLGPQLVPKYRKQRYKWRGVGWLLGHLYGFERVLHDNYEQVGEEIEFLANAILVRNQHAHYGGSIVDCHQRDDVTRWILREDSLWIDEDAVICFDGEAVGKTFDHACSLVLYLTWRLREWEAG